MHSTEKQKTESIKETMEDFRKDMKQAIKEFERNITIRFGIMLIVGFTIIGVFDKFF